MIIIIAVIKIIITKATTLMKMVTKIVIRIMI